MSASIIARGGFEGVRLRLAELLAKHAAVGVIGARGQQRYDDGDMLTVVEAAISNEYGDANVPPRPFMSLAAHDAAASKLDGAARKQLRLLVRGETSSSAVLSALGNVAAAKIRARIDTSQQWAEPNAPRTVRKKGHARPLQETGALRESIAVEVRDGK